MVYSSMVPDIHAKFHNQQFIMRRAIKPFLTLFVQQAGIFREDDHKWQTFKFTMELLELHWPDSEQRSDVIHASALGHPSSEEVPFSVFFIYYLFPWFV